MTNPHVTNHRAEKVKQEEIAKHGGVWEAMKARMALRKLEEKRLAEEEA